MRLRPQRIALLASFGLTLLVAVDAISHLTWDSSARTPLSISNAPRSASPLKDPAKGQSVPDGGFESYARWLRSVEFLREALIQRGSDGRLLVLESGYRSQIGLLPAALSGPATAPYDVPSSTDLYAGAADIRRAWAERRGIKPGVPRDCREIDLSFSRAMDLETETLAHVLELLNQGRPQDARDEARRAVVRVNRDLVHSSNLLEHVLAGRNLLQFVIIRTDEPDAMQP